MPLHRGGGEGEVGQPLEGCGMLAAGGEDGAVGLLGRLCVALCVQLTRLRQRRGEGIGALPPSLAAASAHVMFRP